MLFRRCAGGILFDGDKVLILQNNKNEWVLPKGIIRDNAGETSYEFYSFSRQQPVCNQISWFLMEPLHDNVNISKEDGFKDGGFFPIEDAIERITYSQDKSLVRVSYEKIKKEAQIGA